MNERRDDRWPAGRQGDHLTNRARDAEVATFELLLDNAGPNDVPDGYAALANMLLAARAPATEHELAGESAAVTRFRSSHVDCETPAVGPGRRSKALAVAAALIVVTATGAAAAAGRLPADLQDMTSEVLDHIGIHVPHAHRADPGDIDRDEPRPLSRETTQEEDRHALSASGSVASRLTSLKEPVAAHPAPTPPPDGTGADVLATAAPPLPPTSPVEPAIVAKSGGEDPASEGPTATIPLAGAAPPAAPPSTATPTDAPSSASSANEHARSRTEDQAGDRPLSDDPSPNAPGPPAAVPANDHASPNAPGPPADVPANDHASPRAPGPPADLPANAPGPPADVPANDHASSRAPGPPDASGAATVQSPVDRAAGDA